MFDFLFKKKEESFSDFCDNHPHSIYQSQIGWDSEDGYSFVMYRVWKARAENRLEKFAKEVTDFVKDVDPTMTKDIMLSAFERWLSGETVPHPRLQTLIILRLA